MKLLSNILALAAFLSSCLGLTLTILYPFNTSLINGVWGFTILLVLVILVLHRNAVIGFFLKKSTRNGANMAFVIFLVLGILVFVNIIAKEYHWKKDFTKSGLNSLSPQSIKILKDLNQDIKIYYFNNADEKEKADAMFRNYSYLSKHIQYEFVDVAKRPTLTQTMQVSKLDTTVFVPADSKKQVKVEGSTEEKITNGLMKLLRTKEINVYFVSGHDERSIQSQDQDAQGFSLAKSELEKQNYKIKEVNLMAEGKVPDDASVLILAGPKKAFFPKELEILSAWLKKGGRALFAFDLDINAEGLYKGSAQAAQLLAPYGLRVSDRMLVDPTSQEKRMDAQVLFGFVQAYSHPITKDFPSSKIGSVANFYFPITTYLAFDGVNNSEVSVIPLVQTSQRAWAESDWKSLKSGSVTYQADKDKVGPMVLAAAIEDKQTKIVAFASSNFVLNGLIDKLNDRDLFVNAVAWLSGDEQFISIRAKEDTDGDKLQANPNSLSMIFIISVIVMPLLLVFGGIYISWKRSKQ